MQKIPKNLPRMAGKFLSQLPSYPGSRLFVAGLNLVLAKHLAPDVLRLLNQKKICIRVIDAQLEFYFQWQQSAFVACREHPHCDLMIGASAHDFLLLAQRKEDPDTLFFSRRLLMEGDTELGLLIKNTLDAIAFPVFDPSRLLPGNIIATLRAGAIRTTAAV